MILKIQKILMPFKNKLPLIINKTIQNYNNQKPLIIYTPQKMKKKKMKMKIKMKKIILMNMKINKNYQKNNILNLEKIRIIRYSLVLQQYFGLIKRIIRY
ncbi:hypothetical protein PPERSA_02336 [Pseudocohnilembus persalinus]|uniref:Uncharacterized protein n=1 Tax=Pseudocohnilembus persalinus TaxID=266149 RepID=A0A0V0QTZ9_PSEPJ|nr:hypothetical protein PPERSA_02336 [Pseudocohnilembus persalinus]|eukprot:KRX05804.1 hypothetical protein PPERSA_02336 [Pseudocohnilembus persalinus]